MSDSKNVSLPFVTIGGDLYRLNGHIIEVLINEIVNYHRNEYDYVINKTIDFKSEDDARYMFDVLCRTYNSGWDGGVKHTKLAYEEKILKIVKG